MPVMHTGKGKVERELFIKYHEKKEAFLLSWDRNSGK